MTQPNPQNPWFGIPAEISSQFTTTEEAQAYWDSQKPPEPPKLEDKDGNPLTFKEAADLAYKNLDEAIAEQVRLIRGSVDLYDIAQLAKGDFKVDILID